MNSPDLKFKEGDRAGFTSTGTTGFGAGLKPAIVVRELIQNSLDAAREAKRDVAHIRFEVKTEAIKGIPGIEAYKQALDKAIKDQKKSPKLPSHAEKVVNAMQNCLDKEKVETLYVFDNGIGLDVEKMKALLTDGVSEKSDAQTGAFGNGHMAVIPASNLRYILYGGLSKKEDRDLYIASGHAVLASREGEKGETLSKDGFFIKKYENYDNPYVFPKNKEIPDYIQKALRHIKEKWNTSGSVVIVPGFNRFGEAKKETSLWDIIAKVAACNFFAAISDGKLIVEYSSDEDGNPSPLDNTEIKSILKKFIGDKTRKYGKFISPANAFSAYEALQKGKKQGIPTEVGEVSICIDELPCGGRSRFDLCRNGMWITDDKIPKLKPNHFTEFKPFHCVLLVTSKEIEIHKLIRDMEGPLHSSLEIKNLSKEDRKKFKMRYGYCS